MSDGNSSIMTQLNIMPRVVRAGGETLDFRWTIAPETARYNTKASKDIATRIFKLAQPLGKTTLQVVIEGTVYEVDSFDMTFYQPIDHKGQPEEEVHGGIISFTIPQISNSMLDKWMFSTGMLKNGEFQFKQGDSSMPLRVIFTEAYCIGQKNYTSGGMGVATSLTISSNIIELNNKSIYNRFKL